jgi:formylglycine-generating enzyme required for sulfatase activity
MADLVIRRERKQARYFVEKLGDIGLDMILIPGGTFLMGSPEDEPDRSNDEGPQHEVDVSQFFMGRYPVTQDQWKFVAEQLPQINRKLSPNPSEFKGDRRPVEQVSWYDAVEFCDRLSRYTHREYRLPSEAEWEYACRAGTTTPFYFGKTLTPELANYDGDFTYNDGPKGEYREATTSVDQFGIANGFGLCDMHGNVYEWCQDHWHDNYEGAPTDSSAWSTDNAGSRRVVRGGAWYLNPGSCRSASHTLNAPDFAFNGISFRVVCIVPKIVSKTL